MDKIEYINQRLTVNYFSENDYVIISSLIYSLTPIEACRYFDLTFEQNYRVRRYIIKKISNDISKKYSKEHKKLIGILLIRLDEKPFGRRESCAYSLDFLIDSLPTRTKRRIIEAFLASKSIRIRERAYKRLNTSWDKKFGEIIEQVWHSYHDSLCLGIILNHFSLGFLLNNYKDILKYTQVFQASKLFIKIGSINYKLIEEFKKVDEISYCYVLTKLNKSIPENEAMRILEDNFKDERIGLLLWSFGQMGLWNSIVEYDNKYRERHRKAALEKLGVTF